MNDQATQMIIEYMTWMDETMCADPATWQNPGFQAYAEDVRQHVLQQVEELDAK